MRSDQEPAIASWVNEVGGMRGAAGVERAVHFGQDQVRVMRALQERLKVDVSHRHEVGRDGRTACEWLKAKKAKPLGMELGDLVQWRTRSVGSGALEKLDLVWDHGVSLGVKGKTGEIVIWVIRGPLDPGHGAGQRSTVEDERGRRQSRRRVVREVAGTRGSNPQAR